MACRGQLHASEAKPKRSLEKAVAKAVSLGEGRLWQVTTGRDMPPLIHTMRHFLRQAQFFFGGADFFSAKRLFLREARDVSGAHSEPPWAREGKSRKTHFWLFPTRRPTIGRKPSHPRPPDFLFSSIHQNPTIPPKKKEHSLLVLPSVHSILKFATKFFEMLTKKQSEHPQKVFQVF